MMAPPHPLAGGAVYAVLFSVFFASSVLSAEIPLGVNWGTVADNLPSPEQAVGLLQSTIINRVKLFGVDAGILKALANTGIEVMVGVGNDQIKPLADKQAARQWVQENVVPYVPATKISYLSVGNEVLSTSDGVMIYDLQFAMANLYEALGEAGVKGVKVTTAHSMGLLVSSVPPSNGTFGAGPAAILPSILAFLARTGAPYVANAYPFFGYLGNPNATQLQYALFNASNAPRYDNVTRLYYTNMFDAQVDAVYAAIARLGFHNITVAVGETGWPSAGDPYEPGVSLINAKTFNSNLVKQLTSGKGTPLKPNSAVETYIFALFNEDLKPGAASERNYGLFKADMTPVYDCGIMKKKAPQGVPSAAPTASPPPPPPATTSTPRASSPRPSSPSPSDRPPVSSGAAAPVKKGSSSSSSKQWCVAKPTATDSQLQGILDWACQQKCTDCASLQPSGRCYSPNTLRDHASYAMNSYYQCEHRNPWNCDFGGNGVVTDKDPSNQNFLLPLLCEINRLTSKFWILCVQLLVPVAVFGYSF